MFKNFCIYQVAINDVKSMVYSLHLKSTAWVQQHIHYYDSLVTTLSISFVIQSNEESILMHGNKLMYPHSTQKMTINRLLIISLLSILEQDLT